MHSALAHVVPLLHVHPEHAAVAAVLFALAIAAARRWWARRG